jgi:hypothetical protein
MTKKDYELFAREIFSDLTHGNATTSKDVQYAVALCLRVFKQDNVLFQADKFEEACYTGKHIRKAIANS